MPPRRITQPKPAARDLKAWLKNEYNDEAKYQANLVHIALPTYTVTSKCRVLTLSVFLLQQLAKAVALFVGSVVVMRNFGDAFAI